MIVTNLEKEKIALIDFINLFGCVTWLWISVIFLIPAIQPLIMIYILKLRYMTVKPWIAVLCAVLTITSLACAFQRYSFAKTAASPTNLFNSYEDIKTHENFDYQITVYDEQSMKQVLVYDKKNELTFKFIVTDKDGEVLVQLIGSGLQERN